MILHLISLVGLTLIIVRGTIFARLQRFWPKLFRCSQCAGFWIGVVSVAGGVVTAGHSKPVDAMIIGAATSFLAMFADAILISLLGDPKE